jgi:hypothetical protein
MMPIWIIYESPSDALFVARLWMIGADGATPTVSAVAATTLADVRASLPPGLACLQREPGGDDCIVEVWI